MFSGVERDNHVATLFTCNNCGRHIRVPDNSVGQQVRCPVCETMLTITAPGQTPPPAPPPAAPPMPYLSPAQPPAHPAPPRARTPRKYEPASGPVGSGWVAWIGVVAAIVVGVLLLIPSMRTAGLISARLVGGVLGLIGAIGTVVVAFRERLLHGFLCLFVPFYILYYTFSRWSETAGLFVTYLLGVAILNAPVFLRPSSTQTMPVEDETPVAIAPPSDSPMPAPMPMLAPVRPMIPVATRPAVVPPPASQPVRPAGVEADTPDAREARQRQRAESALRSLNSHLRAYASANDGKFPAALAETLVAGNTIRKLDLASPNDPRARLQYEPGQTRRSPGRNVLAHDPTPLSGGRIVVLLVNGLVEQVGSAEELDKRLAEQRRASEAVAVTPPASPATKPAKPSKPAAAPSDTPRVVSDPKLYTQAQRNMTQLYKALRDRAAGFYGKYPDSLEQLIREGWLKEEDRALLQSVGWPEKQYVYIKGLTNQSGEELLLFYDPAVYADKMRLGVTARGRTLRLPQDEFKALLAKQQGSGQ